VCPVDDTESPDPRELDGVIAELDATGRTLPRSAIQRIRAHRDLAVPRLIEVIRTATANARAGDVPRGNTHFFALFLLAEFQAKEALPAILDAVLLPGEEPFDLFGDAITEVLMRVLAALASDRPQVIDDLIANRDANEYVRSAAAESLVLLVRDGRMERQEAVGRLAGHLRAAIDQDDSVTVGHLVSDMVPLAPKEARDLIDEAFARDMVDPWLIDKTYVEQSIAQGDAWVGRELDRCAPTGIPDTIAELEAWAAFRQERPTWEPRQPARPGTRAPASTPAMPPPPPEPIRGSSKVARNAPCPCGSGLKYKKCCGSGSLSVSPLQLAPVRPADHAPAATRTPCNDTLPGTKGSGYFSIRFPGFSGVGRGRSCFSCGMPASSGRSWSSRRTRVTNAADPNRRLPTASAKGEGGGLSTPARTKRP